MFFPAIVFYFIRISALIDTIESVPVKGGIMPDKEKYTISGDEVVQKVKQLIHEGNIRRVRIIHKGNTVLEIPLSIGAPAAAVGIITAPFLAALGAFAALITECTVEVEKVAPGETSDEKGTKKK
jgi:hypothetical protein